MTTALVWWQILKLDLQRETSVYCKNDKSSDSALDDQWIHWRETDLWLLCFKSNIILYCVFNTAKGISVLGHLQTVD